jgi:tryptophanyl-tRNA synthetase
MGDAGIMRPSTLVLLAVKMATPQTYIPDGHRLAASLPAIYAGHPDAHGLPAARRIAITAAELIGSCDLAVDPTVVNTAALLHLAGRPEDVNRAEASVALASAWLRGSGGPELYIAAVASAIEGAWSEASEDDNGRLLRDAALLDLVTVERHADALREVPPTGRLREGYLSDYRRECLAPALRVREFVIVAGATAIYDQRMPRLAAWLDEQPASLAPEEWRRLVEVCEIERGVERLLTGEDPALVRSEMPARGLPYAEYRGRQRAVIAGSHDRILELTHARIEASRNVAAEKYLESDTIHKPAVEENLFVGARRRARQLGLSAETAEDIARLLLSNAREVQERTLNDIAQRLSRLHGQILDADSPETRTEEADIAIPSLVVRTGDQPLARENELIKELRVTGLNEAYPDQRERLVQWFESPHPYMKTGMIVGSRDADLFLQALTDGQRCKVIATVPIDGPMHLGNGSLVNMLAYFQNLGADVELGFRDELGEIGQARRAMQDALLTMFAVGLDPDRTKAYLQQDSPGIVRTAFELGEAIPLSVLNSALGLRLRDSATDTFRPLLRLSDILHPQWPDSGGPCRTLVLDGIGGDVYVRMARNVAERFGLIKPSALYLRMMRGLTTYNDPRTGSAVEVMTNAVPAGRIAYDDDHQDVRRRVGRAYTGGRGTLEEQRELGGNPDPRVCSVSSLHAFFATPDPDQYAQLQSQCRSGELLCGECKASATDGLLEYLREHRQRRDNLPDGTVDRARRVAGLATDQDNPPQPAHSHDV